MVCTFMNICKLIAVITFSCSPMAHTDENTARLASNYVESGVILGVVKPGDFGLFHLSLRFLGHHPNSTVGSYPKVFTGINSSLIFTCNSSDSFDATTSWMFNGLTSGNRSTVRIPFCSGSGFVTKRMNRNKEWCMEGITDNNTRVISSNVQRSQEGILKCVLATADKSQVLAEARVDVKVIDPIEIINTMPKTILVPVGGVINVSCGMTTCPFTTFTWSRSFHNLNSVDWQVIGILFNYLEDGASWRNQGWYRCVGTNPIGSLAQTTRVLVLGPPDSVHMGHIKSLRRAEVHIHWYQPQENNGKVLSYTLQLYFVHTHSFEMMENITLNAAKRMYTFGNLNSTGTYQVRMYATNKFGDGPVAFQYFTGYTTSTYGADSNESFALKSNQSHVNTSTKVLHTLSQIPPVVFVVGASVVAALIVIPMVTWYCLTRNRYVPGQPAEAVTSFRERVWRLVSGEQNHLNFANPLYELRADDSMVEVNDASTNTEEGMYPLTETTQL